MKTNKDMKWTVLRTEHIIDRPWLNVNKDIVQLPNGKIYDEFYIMHFPEFVNIIAITKDGHFILERQYRHALGVVSTEGVLNLERLLSMVLNANCRKKLDILAEHGKKS